MAQRRDRLSRRIIWIRTAIVGATGIALAGATVLGISLINPPTSIAGSEGLSVEAEKLKAEPERLRAESEGSNDEPAGTHSFSAAGLPAAVQEALDKYSYLPLPPGATLQSAARVREDLKADPNASYEEGIQEMMVLHDWSCAWKKEVLDASDQKDQKRLDEAMKQLYYSLTIPKYIESFVGMDEWAESVLDPVTRGNFGPLSDEYSLACRYVSDQ
ncbi:hypothetical protein [Lysinibacter sp. HNR]|uniref:hypothetical protein n=1 Tax=Lysinibacter sp. HNR TaxID=3031408 RepID=UPI002434D3C5|nr:hypothetical protein [Lysinibacter sp. HNR]WGD38113.1 hypothetical protein FrondiHNR_04125 [Lysinibacter sp. HNR]